MQEKRYAEITVRDILDRAGIGSSTFYTHYFDKEDVQSSLLEQVFEQLFQQLLQRNGRQGIVPSLELFQHIQHANWYQNIAKEMGHAHSRLETRAEPLCHRICGTLPTMSFQAVSTVVLTDSFLILLYKLSAGNRKGNTLCSLVTPGMTIWLNP
jgi:AcrR family transcriptional regulator